MTFSCSREDCGAESDIAKTFFKLKQKEGLQALNVSRKEKDPP